MEAKAIIKNDDVMQFFSRGYEIALYLDLF